MARVFAEGEETGMISGSSLFTTHPFNENGTLYLIPETTIDGKSLSLWQPYPNEKEVRWLRMEVMCDETNPDWFHIILERIGDLWYINRWEDPRVSGEKIQLMLYEYANVLDKKNLLGRRGYNGKL